MENFGIFLEEENTLKQQEGVLLAQKAILTKEEYKKKSDVLRKKVVDYQSRRRTSLDAIAAQRANAKNALLEKLNPILETYIKKNDISLIVNKKNIVMGNTDLDITKIIVEKLNQELPSLSIE